MFIKKYLKEIFLSVIILLLLGIYGFIYYEYFYLDQNHTNIESQLLETDIEEEKEEPKEKDKNVNMNVEIKGAVLKPGVYAVTDDDIINDIVTMAGGFLDNAYTNNINLSKKIEDEMVIYVYTKYEFITMQNKKEETKSCSCDSYDISKCTESKSSIITYKKGSSSSNVNEENGLVNINTASVDELMTLSGIGEVKAKKIIEYRETNGPFASIEDIVNVSGISQNTFENIKENITV